MRVFALSSKNRPLALVVLLLSSGPIVVDFVRAFLSVHEPEADPTKFSAGSSRLFHLCTGCVRVWLCSRLVNHG